MIFGGGFIRSIFGRFLDDLTPPQPQICICFNGYVFPEITVTNYKYAPESIFGFFNKSTPQILYAYPAVLNECAITTNENYSGGITKAIDLKYNSLECCGKE